jgi:TolB protein
MFNPERALKLTETFISARARAAHIFKLIVGACLFMALPSWAQLTIQIQKGVDKPISIAVVPFGWDGPMLPEDIASIVGNDLKRSGQFAPLPSGNMLSMPHEASEVVYRDWRALNVDWVVVGKITPLQNGYTVQYELFDAINQREVLLDREIGYNDSLRDVAHHIADKVYEKITGIRGIFSLKLLYVSALRDAQGQNTYRLMLSDADGAREQILRTQREPLMTPSWAPDGETIAYTSFETRRPAIYIENLRTRARQQVTDFPGINSSPTWSPDGRKLAMVLSKDGNPEIYTMDVASHTFTRITNHFSIDTEPSWSADGRSILFTSDRGGKPQIYQVGANGGEPTRLTFDGNYNARPRAMPDGSGFVYVHRENGDFHIMLQDTKRGITRPLTQASLDESPCVAPNSAMLIYATLYGGRGILAAVSVDAGTRYLMPSRFGDVREPAWSPFIDRH